MKVVIQRHARDFCIYRLGAIAQAFAALKNEVQIECLEEFRRALALCPEIGWKNPHHPFEVAERRFIGEGGKDQVRPGGRRYDLVVNLDGDGLFEPRWASLGQPWWSWAKQEAKAALAMLPFISDWPEITAPLPAANVGKPYVLIATLSDECLASQINVNELDRFVRAKFPDCAVLWSAPKPLLIREGFATLVFGSYLELAAQIREARAVFAVNGMAGATAFLWRSSSGISEASQRNARPRNQNGAIRRRQHPGRCPSRTPLRPSAACFPRLPIRARAESSPSVRN